MLTSLLLLATLLVPAHLATTWSNSKYAVDCPERCDSAQCNSVRCRRTVLDDCGCCRVCAAGRGEICYRTVSGMDGVKCGPGLKCQFYSEEDDFGDEYGICKDCPYGTFGMECKETCNCPLSICDRVTGKCLKFPFFQYSLATASNRLVSHTDSANIFTTVETKALETEVLLVESDIIGHTKNISLPKLGVKILIKHL